AAEQSLAALADALLSLQVDFDYLGDDALADAVLDDGGLRVGPMRYEALLIPRCYAVPAAGLRQIAAATEAGVVAAGVGRPSIAADAPEDTDLLDRAWRAVRQADNEEQVAQLAAAEVGPTARLTPARSAVRCCRRITANYDIVFLTSEVDEPLSLSLDIDESDRPYLCDPGTGDVTAIRRSRRNGRVSVGLRLDPWGSALLLLDRTGAARRLASPPRKRGRIVRARDLTWSARPLERLSVSENGITPVSMHDVHRPLAFDGWRTVDPYFSGRVEYTAAWDADEPGDVTLDLGQVRRVVELWVNDQRVGTEVWPPYRFPIGPYLRPGTNALRAVVTNTLANEFARPETKALMRELGWHNVYRQRAEGYEAEEIGQR
ncbi:MAG: hypothetical protein JSV65_15810, partial [Armatimonadota bacterium]